MHKYLALLLTLPALLVTTQTHADQSAWDTAAEEYAGAKEITVYRDPACGCCSKWITHLEHHGFQVTDMKTSAMARIKQEYHVPQDLASCHTAVIEGYVIEGHVPADDIKRLLLTRPDIRGLSVPMMPVGTPGMEMGDRKDPFRVISFTADGGQGVFREYTDY